MKALHFTRRGFTLLEIVIAVAILAILAGAVLPLAGKAFQSKARAATRNEAAAIAEAVGLYVHDTLAFPAAVDELLVRPAGVLGWTGPYLPYMTDDPLSAESDWTVDAWSRPYALALVGDVLTIASGGPDGETGGDDDVVFQVDATPVRRARTLEQLAVLNRAVGIYNDSHLPDDPLPTAFALLLEELVDAGLLPSPSGLETDAWGDGFTPMPPGQSPVVAIGSVNVGG
jgi:prepilin-type N-terminal cleavage/methylation domain-containing protein